jgi:hypothetical protein
MSGDEQVVVSPLSAAMTGLPWHKWVDEIRINHRADQATFTGTLPMDIAKQIRRASLSGRASDMDAHAAFCDGTCKTSPGANCPAEPINEANWAPDDNTRMATELANWWRSSAEAEIEQTVAKAIEYGSTDLIDIGLMLARTMQRAVSEDEAAELGVFFYLIGKIARWQSAIERGERPSKDTLLDIGVYVRMAQRIRSAGGWPGTEKK